VGFNSAWQAVLRADFEAVLQGLFVLGITPVKHCEAEKGVGEDASHRLTVP
jgi:hypothetical protein